MGRSASPAISTTPPGDGQEIGAARLYSLVEPSIEEWDVIYRAVDTAISECMADRGFVYSPDATPVSDAVQLDISPPTEGELREFGYGYWNHRLGLDGVGADDDVDSLSQEAIIALEGADGIVGCGEVGADSVGLREFNAVLAQLSQVVVDIQMSAQASQRYLDALEAWRDCMTDGGYAVADPDEAVGMAESLSGGVAGEPAIAMAIFDFDCRGATRLSTTRREIEAELVDVWLEENPTTIDEYAGLKDRMVADAAALLGESD